MDVSGVFTPERWSRTPKNDKGDVRVRRRNKGVRRKPICRTYSPFEIVCTPKTNMSDVHDYLKSCVRRKPICRTYTTICNRVYAENQYVGRTRLFAIVCTPKIKMTDVIVYWLD